MNIFITGAARGIGLATAERLASSRHRVFIGVRDVAAAKARVTDIGATSITPVYLDLLDHDSIESSIQEILSQIPYIDGLVNNAGISNLGPLEDQSDDEFTRIMQTNFYGHYHLNRAVLPFMRAREQGRIVMVSSLSGLFGLPGETAYCCSKFAMEAMAACLRFEVAQFGVKVCVVNPSYIRTELAASTDLERATPTESAYRPLMEHLLKVQREGEKAGDDISVVAEAIVDALTSAQPKLRYLPGSAAKLYQTWKDLNDDEFQLLIEQTIGLVEDQH